MKDKYLINYSLFCQRKKFSLRNFLTKNIQMSEDEILNYFRKNSVEPPPIFQIRKLRDEIKLQNQELKIEIVKDQIDVEENKARVLETEEIQKKETPKKKTKRRKKKDV